ncbi:hypothetical protein LAZ67_1007904 [Cordylochernes scorpioides]|uniref:Uncharacterized protein n=1 Tax=Cordylochernes scorpioides TaxID=51811 RepID=A0ABY6K133_9ARAC|nr:hypothetical protein LAZ67_1007904 [Cordylochernes scorpioides]
MRTAILLGLTHLNPTSTKILLDSTSTWNLPINWFVPTIYHYTSIYLYLGTWNKETLKCKVLPNPPYSPDIAPSDYYLFQSMQYGLADQHFFNYDEVKK